MVALDAAQTENLSTALVVARAWAVASGNDPQAVCERVAFCAWTEGRGYNWANDGRNTSNSPGVTPAIAAILRTSLNYPHDKTGSNGRSTGMYQQLSENVGGGWGDMTGTMDPAISTARFLSRLIVTDNPVFAATLITPTGTRRVAITLSDPIAADTLRIQQPLADEAESSNYNATQVAIAREIVAQLSPTGTGPVDLMKWITKVADEAKLKEFILDVNSVGGQDVRNLVNFLYQNELIAKEDDSGDNYPYSRSADTWNIVRAIAEQLASAESQVDQKTYGPMGYLVSIDRKLTAVLEKLDNLAITVDPEPAA
jgi:hypothetical protein